MAKRLSIMLVALLALGFTVAACGDEEEDKANEAAPAATEPSAPADEGGGGAAAPDPDSPQVQQAIDSCKEQVDANPQVSAEAKEKIGEVCEEAASGDADAAIKATEEACKILVEDTAPAGPGRDTALKACEQTAQ